MSAAEFSESHALHGAAGASIATLAARFSIALLAVAYVSMALAQRRSHKPWRTSRTVAFLIGCGFVELALLPELSPYPHGDFREHMLQHLLLGMIAPVALVLAAPMTLLLRTLPQRHARQLVDVVRSRPMHVLAHPFVALVLSVGGMGALYLTPLYTLMLGHPALHAAIHAHFLLAGCLFAWVIAGPDPAPRRPRLSERLLVLGIAIALHSTVAQLIYANVLVAVPASETELHGAAALMYYGGDIAELVLAFAAASAVRRRRSSEFVSAPAP